MVGSEPGFWATIFKPIQTDTVITPTLAVLRIVTPLSLVLATFTRGAPSSWFFALAVLPVATVLFQIILFTVLGKTNNLRNDEFLREMEKLKGLMGSNDGTGPKEMRVVSAQDSNNPRLNATGTLLTSPLGDEA